MKNKTNLPGFIGQNSSLMDDSYNWTLVQSDLQSPANAVIPQAVSCGVCVVAAKFCCSYTCDPNPSGGPCVPHVHSCYFKRCNPIAELFGGLWDYVFG